MRLLNTVILLVLLSVMLLNNSCADNSDQPIIPESIPTFTYRIVNTYNHDSSAFTQGLVFEDGILYEGTGLYGESSLRKVDLQTGNILQIRELSENYFGEGITVFKDVVIQLTWKSKIGFVYDKNNFNKLHDFSYPTEGWGITHDGRRLIMSDGTSTLYFLDPESFGETGRINVLENETPVNRLNELEYINGKIYANVWQTDKIAIIDPVNGQVDGWIDLTGILDIENQGQAVNVLNGIAYNTQTSRLLVTGKLWPYLFEIELVAQE